MLVKITDKIILSVIPFVFTDFLIVNIKDAIYIYIYIYEDHKNLR